MIFVLVYYSDEKINSRPKNQIKKIKFNRVYRLLCENSNVMRENW